MAKDAYWFPHDANARRDPKTSALIAEYGYEGYGRFWAICEILREQPDYKLDVSTKFGYHVIAKELLMPKAELEAFIKACVEEFNLLFTDGKYLWSESLTRRMEPLDAKRKVLSDRGKKGAAARHGMQDSQQAENNAGTSKDSDATSSENSSRVDKSRVDKSTVQYTTTEPRELDAWASIPDVRPPKPNPVVVDLTEFRNVVLGYWKANRPGGLCPPALETEFQKLYCLYGAGLMLWAMRRFILAGHKDTNLIRRALEGAFDFDYKDKRGSPAMTGGSASVAAPKVVRATERPGVATPEEIAEIARRRHATPT